MHESSDAGPDKQDSSQNVSEKQTSTESDKDQLKVAVEDKHGHFYECLSECVES